MSADAAQLAALHKAAFPYDPWDTATFATFMADATSVLVAEPHGFALLRVVVDEAEVLTLAVAPTAQGHGHGTALLQRAVTQAQVRGAHRVVLEVAADNLAARAVYARAGFEQAGLRRGYYPRAGGPAVDALLLVRALA